MTPVRAAALIAAWIPLALAHAACTRPASDAQAPSMKDAAIHRFQGDVYGASGVVQLPDGRLLVAGDDQRNPLEIVDVFGSGAVTALTRREVARALSRSGAATGELNDLEALTIDPRGHIYGITSHGLTTKAVDKPDREQLLRFDVSRGRIESVRVYSRLKPALLKLDPVFETAAAKTPAAGGLNIEGLAWDPMRNRLLIGFRSPRKDGRALAVWLDNPDAVFDQQADAVLARPVPLNLSGEGIRDVTYSTTLKAFVILAGPWRHRASKPPTVWTWLGGGDEPIELQTPDVDELKPEGVAEVVANAAPALLVVSDDGNADDLYGQGRALRNSAVSSRYMILPFDTLQPMPATR